MRNLAPILAVIGIVLMALKYVLGVEAIGNWTLFFFIAAAVVGALNKFGIGQE